MVLPSDAQNEIAPQRWSTIELDLVTLRGRPLRRDLRIEPGHVLDLDRRRSTIGAHAEFHRGHGSGWYQARSNV
jgi:hypothetical protein